MAYPITPKGFIKRFKNFNRLHLGIRCPRDLHVTINQTCIDIAILQKNKDEADYNGPMFKSDVRVYLRKTGAKLKGQYAMEISYGSSGSFTNRDKAEVGRTMIASYILQFWPEVKQLVTQTLKHNL